MRPFWTFGKEVYKYPPMTILSSRLVRIGGNIPAPQSKEHSMDGFLVGCVLWFPGGPLALGCFHMGTPFGTCARNRFNQKEDFQVVLSERNPGESSCQQQTKWVAHWTRASSSAYGKSSSPLEDAKKSSVTERLMLGGNHEGIFMEKLNSNMWGVSHDVRQEAEQRKNERRDGSFRSSVMLMPKDESFYAKTVVSETLSVCRLSDLPMDEQGTGHYFANPNQEPLSICGGKQFNLSENSDEGQTVGGASQNHKSGTPAGLHKQQVAAGVVLSLPVLGKEYKTLPINYFMNSKQDDESFHVASHLIPDKHHDLNSHRTEYAANVTDSCMLPDPPADILIINSMGSTVTHEKKPVDKFTDSVKQNGSCLFEMLTIPSKSQSTYRIDSVSSCSHLFGAQNQFSHKTKTMHGDAQYVSKSSAGIASSLMQKDNGCAERANEQLATLSIAGSPRYNKGNRFHNVNDNQHISSKATTSSKQALSTPGTEIMDLDPPLFQSRMRNQVLNNTIRSPAGAEPSDKWLKRLLHDTTDPHVHRSKRVKIGDCRPVGVSGTDIVDHVEARCVRCWLGRLCRGGVAPVSHGEPGQGTREAAEPDVAARELGGHFPSIKAMAMMGQVMSRVRPFDRQRKGPCVMWKAEEGA